MANNMTPETMLMSGVTVDFPYKPYPCQIAMLGRIIKALQQSKNCLLESPTGTGKTLTLLCAALAWQQKEIEQNHIGISNDNKEKTSESITKPTSVSRIFYCTRTHKQLEQVAKQLGNTVYKDKIRMTLLSSRENYCVHPVVSKGPNKNHECSKLTRPDRHNNGTNVLKGECGFYERLKGKTANDYIRLSGQKQLPRVFDIEQFTEYCQRAHAVCPYYTSRLLIHDVQIILCPYNYLIDPRIRNSMQLTTNNAVIIIDEAHNIEDCARESMKFEMRKYDLEIALEELCGNQRALEMAQTKVSELIINKAGFSSTQEPLSLIYLTSAQHQSARRVAGYSELDQLNDDMDLLDHLNIDQQGNVQDIIDPITNEDIQGILTALKFLAERFSRLVFWFETKDPREKYTFTPKELIDQYHQAKFIDRSIVNIHKSATKIQPTTKLGMIQDANNIRKALAKCFLNYPEFVKFTDETAKFLEDFDLCLSILYANDYQFNNDYKIILKTIPFELSEDAVSQMQTSSEQSMGIEDEQQQIDTSQKSSQYRRYQKHIVRTSYPLHTQQLIFYCLSPSVAFAKDLKLARSLIFASGTLAPLTTYSGELKLPFDIQLECNHVIDIQRTFITALSHGRNPNIKLRATYQNTDRLDFQDECGLVLLDICQRVPYGVLCFVPSYRFLNAVITRWMASGLWQKLNEYKSVFFEEKNGAAFQNTIDRFCEANGTIKPPKYRSAAAKFVKAMFNHQKTVENNVSTNSPYFTCKGGLLLAVCRGRASEGIDFSDNNARCVITLGIPYPNVQDEEVIFKRTYNNEQNKHASQVMNGSDWYDSQGYRALNQALGRCIRHKNDWGALFIVEERVVQSINNKCFNNKISMWIKQRLFISKDYNDTMNSLENFVTTMKKSEDISMIKDEQNQQLDTKFIDDEQRRLSLIVPPLIDASKKTEEKTSIYRQWKIDQLSDNNDDDDELNRIDSKQIKLNAFEKFIAQRLPSMQPPVLSSTQSMKSSPIHNIINLTGNTRNRVRKPRVRRERTRRRRRRESRKPFTQYPNLLQLQPIQPPKIGSSQQTPITIDTSDDDNFM